LRALSSFCNLRLPRTVTGYELHAIYAAINARHMHCRIQRTWAGRTLPAALMIIVLYCNYLPTSLSLQISFLHLMHICPYAFFTRPCWCLLGLVGTSDGPQLCSLLTTSCRNKLPRVSVKETHEFHRHMQPSAKRLYLRTSDGDCSIERE